MKTIKKDKIVGLLDFLAEKYELFAPVSDDNLVVDFSLIKKGDQAKLDFYNSKDAPKKLFFPQCQTLFSYSEESPATVPQHESQKKRVIFGMRPCDAKSMVILDRVFDSPDFKDPYYTQGRKKTVIFALACDNPQTSCFCTSLGLGPFSKDFTDVFVVDLGDKYLLESITQKGRELLNEIPDLEEAEPKDVDRSKALATEAEAKITKKAEIDNLPEKLAELFDDPIWDQVHQKCLGCGVCTYSCPTCHCFDIVDEQVDNKGRRIRIWDSCMYPTFTLEASGHNPRPTGRERMRQRIMHKFNYFVENFGEIACVGCGRCIRSCPVCLDITKAIEKIDKAKQWS